MVADKMVRKGDGTYTVTLVHEGLTLEQACRLVAQKTVIGATTPPQTGTESEVHHRG